MKNKYVRIIVPILIVVEFCSIFLAFNSFNNRDIKKTSIYKRNKQFAIYLKDAGETEYAEWEEDTWPSGDYYILNREMTECSDVYGNPLIIGVDVGLEYSNTGRVTVTSNKTVYCNLYFDFHITAAQLPYDNHEELYTTCEEAQCAIDELYTILKPGKSSELVAGLYRYQGRDADNYICFGTTNKETCTSDTDKYMYRIIGETAIGQLKLIKKEALNTAYAWHANRVANAPWPDSELFTGLNGSYFLSNTNYVPSGWSSMIATTNWKYGNFTNTNATIAEIASTELGFTDTVSAKIGLMYIHDYAYAMPDGNNCTTDGLCEISWINLCYRGNDLSAPNCGYEWSMTHYAKRLAYNQSWVLHSFATLADTRTIDSTLSVRPVFYLTTGQVIASGSGTLSDPFILRIDSII